MKQVENNNSSSTSSSTVSSCCNNNNKIKENDDDVSVILPGFRFHPTDQELLNFYLKRKLQENNKPLNLDIIKEIDIYKYDPWDLPKSSNVGGEKDWYFFCQRERKYRNSVRPNRVTGSGFWKATGIDRPVCAVDGSVIGLKKSLVYYLGSAGKGTKTDWIMHEFRLPHAAQEAEIWTVCRISKRSVAYRKCIPAEWARSKRESGPDPSPSSPASCGFISFTDADVVQQSDSSPRALIAANYSRHHQYPVAAPSHNLMMMGADDIVDELELVKVQGSGDYYWQGLQS